MFHAHMLYTGLPLGFMRLARKRENFEVKIEETEEAYLFCVRWYQVLSLFYRLLNN